MPNENSPAIDHDPADAEASGSLETVHPLIEASEAFPALEQAVARAKESIYLGFRVFDPETRIRSRDLLDRGIRTWGSLIADCCRRGVRVRLLLTDFEPIVATDMHARSWASLRGFQNAVHAAPEETFEGIAALHEAEFGPAARWVFWPLVWARLFQMANGSNDAAPVDKPHRVPGLRPLLDARKGMTLPRFGRPPRMWPVTYHQKIAVIDGSWALVGGLDMNERRFDDPDHRRAASETWHDVSLAVTGPVVDQVTDHFLTCWNREVPRFNARLTAMGAPLPDLPPLVSPLDDTPDAPSPESDPAAVRPGGTLRFVRTVSRRDPSPVALGPRTAVTEIEQAHIDAFATARDLIYIETQFLRSQRIAEALARAGRATPKLRLVIVLPAAPEDVLFEGNDGPAARHGEWLQVRALDRIKSAFGDRVGLFSLVGSAGGEESGRPRQEIDGRPVVYVHSKVTVIDHRLAIVSSANLNGRSLHWDTEAGLVWSDADRVPAFEKRLWQTHLNGVADDALGDNDGAADLSVWRDATQQTRGADAPQVAAYPIEKARRFARRAWFIPNDLV